MKSSLLGQCPCLFMILALALLSSCTPRQAGQPLGASPSASPGPAGKLWIGAVGDVMPGRGTAAILGAENGVEKVFTDVLPFMRAEDFLIANLETAVTERGEPWPKTYRFRVSPSLIGSLKDSSIDLVSLTNNHVYDYKETGFLDTLDNLKAAGLPSVGAGRDFTEAARPWAGTVNGTELRVWALGDYPVERTGFSGAKDAAVQRGKPGILWADERALAELSRQFKELDARYGADGVCKIVAVHAGTEYEGGTNALQRELYHRLINMGADIVIGHHPHVLEPIEWYQGESNAGLIAYSLGNYLFDDMGGIPHADESVLLSIKIEEGRATAIRLDGVKLTGPSIKLDASGAIVKRLLAMSPTVMELVAAGKAN